MEMVKACYDGGSMVDLDGEQYLTGEEAASLLGIKRETLYAYVSRGYLRSYRQGISASGSTGEPKSRTFSGCPRPPGSAPPSAYRPRTFPSRSPGSETDAASPGARGMIVRTRD